MALKFSGGILPISSKLVVKPTPTIVPQSTYIWVSTGWNGANL